MKLIDFDLQKHNHFVAMEYYWFILNRTFLILILEDLLIGIKVNGLISAEHGGYGIEAAIINSMSVKGDLNNPYAYIKSKYLNAVQDLELSDESILQANSANFIIKRSDIKDVAFDPTKKWGMGNYPHEGKIYITTSVARKREFIILGKQSGQTIAKTIMTDLPK